ncbi:MAG: hypothetical protein HQM15_08845 [Deltaproteobacteria bacterium]|nr:hypothetical protein [Deltaproteobacteria bacterium]
MTVDQMTDILDIKPLIPPNVWPLLFVFLAMLILIALLVFYFLRRKKNIENPPPLKVTQTESPREKALRKIEELNTSGLLERHQYRKYYFGMSEILRTFLQEEYAIEAVDATTEELTPKIKQSESFSEEQKFNLLFLLREMDLVKFAKSNPTSESLEKLKKVLKEFIEK